jgi:acyl carrier protein
MWYPRVSSHRHRGSFGRWSPGPCPDTWFRRALPVPEAGADTGTEYVAPDTDTERVVADVWSEVLGLERVGVYDNFFDLGGDSIRSLHIASRVKVAFDVALTPRDVLTTRTVAALAELVEEKVICELERVASGAGNDKEL